MLRQALEFQGKAIVGQRVGRRKILAGAAAGLATPLLSAPLAAQMMPRSFAGRGAIGGGEAATILHVTTTEPVLAMTFDDGPHPHHTPQLLDTLAERGIRATFFVIGRNAARYPLILQRMIAEGHEIGNHTWSHPNLHGHSDASVLSQVDRTNQAVVDAVGRPPVLMRPPYGNLYNRHRMMLFETRGMPTILWSVDPLDWQRPGSAVVSQRIIGRCHRGAVILAHDIHRSTVRAMPATLSGIADRGYRFVTMSELIGWPRWDRRRRRLI
jgi:peptidoglycan/xylan/chitin deacetylase (PgdA/CDA1 family)